MTFGSGGFSKAKDNVALCSLIATERHPFANLAEEHDIQVMATISEALAIAIQHHRAGQLQAAEQIYRQILAAEPNHADTLHL